MSNVHVYSSDNGVLNHVIRFREDLGGDLTVAGQLIPLIGWPTPAMRAALNGIGEPTAWFIGTDDTGNILRV